MTKSKKESKKQKYVDVKTLKKEHLDKKIKEKTEWINGMNQYDKKDKLWAFAAFMRRCSVDEAKEFHLNELENLKKQREELNN